jgi:hypothetical protein
VNVTIKLPEVTELVFPISMMGANGVVFTVTFLLTIDEFPDGFLAYTEIVYVPLDKGM